MRQRGVPRAVVSTQTNGRSSVIAHRDIAWLGIDVGKTHHWACMVDAEGKMGEGKTDAKDAYVIAETARLRRDLSVIDVGTDLIRNLTVLTGHRGSHPRWGDDQLAAQLDDQCFSQPGARL